MVCYPIADRGEKILFCEPSCLSAVKEDAPSLLRGEQQQKARMVAGACAAVRRVRRHARPAAPQGPSEDFAPRPLSSEVHGTACATKALLGRDSVRKGGGSGRGLLRNGRIFRLFEAITTMSQWRLRIASCSGREGHATR